MVVVGIDPGMAITGYGVIREAPNGDLLVIDYGVVRTTTDKTIEQRLLQLYNSLKKILLLHCPDSAAVEKLFFQKNVSTAMAVGQARGVALLALAEAGLFVSEYTPLEIKQAISGYGGAAKKQMQIMVKAILNLDELPKPDDAADALAVGICHIHSRRLDSLISQSRD